MIETYVIHTTKLCNMNCLYCYEKDKSSRYTWKEVKEYIDKLICNRTSNIFNIEFLGGEPLLSFDIITKTIDYITSYKTKLTVKFIITTNGTILTDEMLEFFKKHNDIIIFGASMDGNKTSNQLRLMKNGINSHDIVIKNMKTLIKNNINCYIHMVTHPFNVGYIYDSVIHLYNLGIKNIAVGIVETTIDIDNNFVKSYVNQMKKVSDYILDNNINDIYISELMQIKPLTDIRTYIYDDDGKLVGETYGRSGEDITKTKDYKVVQPYKSNNAKYIEEARLLSYNYHNKL